MLDEAKISRAILQSAFKELISNLNLDVGIAGAGPAGLTAGYYLAKRGRKVAIFERQLKYGGGMPGGGMLFPRVAVQTEGLAIFKEVGVRVEKFDKELWTADSVEAVSKLAVAALDQGVKIYPAVSVEDVVIRGDNRVCGVVINWTAVKLANLHVDPLAIKCRYVIDATGHDAEVSRLVERKNPQIELKIPQSCIQGERSMWAEEGERRIVEYTGEVCKGLFVAGMAVNAVCNLPRMGAVFGGMLLSGRRAAEMIARRLKQ